MSAEDPFVDKREQLLEDAQTDEQELLRAVDELAVIAQNRLGLGSLIAGNPVPWIAGSLLLGFWLGARR